MDFSLIKEGDITPQENAVISNTNSNATDNKNPATRASELLSLHQSMPKGLNFEATKEMAMECIEAILEHWLPDGEQRGKQYVPVNPTRSDSEPGSFQINTENGMWKDFAAGDAGSDLISLVAYLEGCGQVESAVKILEFIAGMNANESAAIIKRSSERKSKPSQEWTAIMPIPPDAKKPPVFFGTDLGKPSSTWEYRNAEGQVMCFVNRFETKPRKTYLPLSYCKDTSGHCQWKYLSPPVPRPAYGLDRLAAMPEAPVLFTEGEKSADAAQRLFPSFVATTTMHGAQSPEYTDFSVFKGRNIYIAPDYDNAGIQYKHTLIAMLRSVGVVIVGSMRIELLSKIEGPLNAGYDLADAEMDGWTTEELAKLGSALWAPVATEHPSNTPETSLPKKEIPADKNKRKSQMELAIEFATQNYAGHVAYFNNQFLAYSDGYWSALNPDVDIKRPILTAIGNEATASRINGVYELIKIQYASKPETFERNSPLICLNNATLNPISGEHLPHTVDHYLTNKVKIDFDADATCPLWLQTLDEIFQPDSDKAAKIQLLQEYIGYCLIPDTRMHKFLWMVGAGGNGKSLVSAIITALIGKENISYAPIERLQEKFIRAELQGKLVNMSTEMGAQATVSDGYLKQITAGDIIEAERKHERPFSFRPYARLIGATNALPRLLDHSDGFFRRAIILRFNRQFSEAQKDVYREAKLMAELPGIMNWAVTGLQNLLERKHFEIPDSSKAEVEQYRVGSDPVRQFAEEYLTKIDNKDRWIGSGALYDYYRSWSTDNGYKTLASNQFAERLTGVGFTKCRTNSGRYWEAEYCDPDFRQFPPAAGDTPKQARYVV